MKQMNNLLALLDEAINSNPEQVKKMQSFIDSLFTPPSDFSETEKSTNNPAAASLSLADVYLKNYIGTLFKHNTKGTTYILLSISNTKSTDFSKFPITAIYFDLKNNTVWSRPLIDFDQSFSPVA